MINKLKKKFIKIAMLSVAAVMVFLCAVLNIGNYISVNGDLKTTLVMISENPGLFEERKDERPKSIDAPWSEPADSKRKEDWDFSGKKGPFNRETLYSLRFFTLEFSGDGELLSSNLGNIISVDASGIKDYLAAAKKKGEGFGFYDGYKYYVYKSGEDTYTAIFLSAFSQLRSFRNLLFVSVLAAVGCILLVYILVVLLSRKAIDPVVKAAEKQKQFITDAGHELKTPLTVINTSLSVLEMDVGENKWIEKAKGQTEKMGELVSSLVTLSRMDEEEPAMNVTDMDISGALRETAESFRETAEQKGYSLSLDIEEGLSFRGDEYMVRQLVSILLENAMKYTAPEGTVKLTLAKDKKGVVITESNPCEDLDTEELPKLFDRFYRSDKARTSGKGFGVGLSIAKAIAEAHKGEITASLPRKDVIEFKAVLRNI